MNIRITLEMSEQEAEALAQFVKRSRWEHYTDCAVDTDEAYLIRDAVNRLQIGLSEAGFAPR